MLNISGNMIMQVHIAQRGAITPLITMLQSSDEQVMEMTAFALGRLAQVVMFLNQHVHCFYCFWNLALYRLINQTCYMIRTKIVVLFFFCFEHKKIRQ